MTTVGEITLIAKIDTSQYKKGAEEVKKSNKDMVDSTDDVEKSSGRGSAALATLGKVAKVAALATGAALAAGLTAASKASWDQVAAVEQATVGLRAYERDGSKVNAVLADLIKYARSDMGVLFNRKDLFQSAQMLKLNGVATGDLVKNVEILSRSVGLGLGNWQDLNNVVGRVVSTGRLSGIEFDQLTQYGYKLDKSLRNTNVSATDLFNALDKGIPVEAMAGQANSIRGIGIRLQTAFRGIGDAILGVDADTSKFIEGGLGDRLVKGLGSATEALKNFQQPIRDISTSFVSGLSNIIPKIIELGRQVGDYLGPKLTTLWTTVSTQLFPALNNLWKNVIQPLIPVIGTAFVLVIGLAIDAINLMILAITPLISFLSEHKDMVWLVIGALVAYKGALIIGGVATKFIGSVTAMKGVLDIYRTQGLASAIRSTKIFQVLVKAPLSMPAIAVAAAIASIALVYKAVQTVIGAIDAMNAAAKSEAAFQNTRDASVKSIQQSITKARKRGDQAGVERGQRVLRNLLYNTPGYASGGFTGRGGMNEIAGVVHKGEFVIPKEFVDQNTGKPKTSTPTMPQITVKLTHSPSAMRQAALDTIELVNQVYRAKGLPEIGVA